MNLAELQAKYERLRAEYRALEDEQGRLGLLSASEIDAILWEEEYRDNEPYRIREMLGV